MNYRCKLCNVTLSKRHKTKHTQSKKPFVLFKSDIKSICYKEC